MSRVWLFLLFAALLRATAAALRADPPRRSLRAAGWAVAMVSTWIAASGAGAWTPLGPALLAAVLGAPIEWRRRRTILRLAAEGGVFLLAGFLSVPPLAPLRTAAFLLLWVPFGFTLDRLFLRRGAMLRWAAALLPLFAVAAIRLLHPWAVSGAWRTLVPAIAPSRVVFLAFGPAPRADRIVLPGGAVAWFERSPEGDGAPGAVLLHGADRRGSAQAAAQALRRALRDAGYAVLAVDHPGYGESPLPDTSAIETWDPLPDEAAAFDTLRAICGGAPVIVVGHSMGVREAVRLVGARPDAAGAALFGGSLEKRGPQSDYWYERFHTDRRLDRRISREKVDRICALYYDTLPLIRLLPANRTRILFVRFGREHEDVEAMRDVLFARLPAPKESWDLLGTDHYFNSGARIGLVAGDLRAIRRASALLRRFREGTPR
ncbi:MAG: alpha/beta fold hydrolase [Candidatus Eisenbacteria bacterium]|nr:alpha/beta fold hydrolase [Candidatus Eisenbacteria bacterium]